MTGRSSYLGQFTWEQANAVAAGLEEAGIGWWHKQSSGLGRFVFAGDWGVRIFVDSNLLSEARSIAASVLGQREGQDPGLGEERE